MGEAPQLFASWRCWPARTQKQQQQEALWSEEWQWPWPWQWECQLGLVAPCGGAYRLSDPAHLSQRVLPLAVGQEAVALELLVLASRRRSLGEQPQTRSNETTQLRERRGGASSRKGRRWIRVWEQSMVGVGA